MDVQEKILRKLFVGVTMLSFFVPFVFAPRSLTFPFIVPKVVFFRILLTILVGLYSLLLYKNYQKYKVTITYVHGALLFMVVSYLFSTFAGVNPYFSFWEGHERMIGVFSTLHYYIYFVLLAQFFTTYKEWKKLIYINLIVGVILTIIGGIQYFIDPNFFYNGGGKRVFATFGNPIYYGGYSTFILFLSLFAYYKDKSKIFLFTGLCGLVSLIFSGTRGAILAILIAPVISGGLVLLQHKEVTSKYRKKYLIFIAAGILILGSLFIMRDNTFVRNFPGVGRLVKTNIVELTTSPRALAIKVGINAWKAKPYFGWGPNNYASAFNAFYPPELLSVGGWGETWFDNAHNYPINVLATQGIIGFFAYIIGIILIIIFLFQKRKKHEITDVELFIFLFFYLVYLISNVTVFDNPISLMYYAIFLALIHVKKQGIQNNKDTNDLSIAFIIFISAIIIMFNIVTNINILKGNNLNLLALKNLRAGNIELVEKYYKQAKESGSVHNLDFAMDLSKNLTPYVGKVGYTSIKSRSSIVDILISDLEREYKRASYDARIPLVIESLLRLKINNTPESLPIIIKRIEILEQSLLTSPGRHNTLFVLSDIYYSIGQGENSLVLLEKSLNQAPHTRQTWASYIVMLDKLNKKEKLQKAFEELDKLNIVFKENLHRVRQIRAKYNIK